MQGIGWSGLLIGSTLREFDSAPGRDGGRSCGSQIACDLVDLRRTEAALFFLFATGQENG